MAKKKAKFLTATITLPNGFRKYFRAKTREELDQRILEARMAIGAGVDISNDMTFGEYADIWFRTVKLPSLRKSSASTMLYTLNHYVLPVLGAYVFRDIKPLHVQQLIASISHLSKSTQSKVLQALRQVFDSAVDNGLIARSPVKSTDKATGKAAPEKEPLTPDQCNTLLQAVWGTRAYPFALLALRTGMRRGEILGLMWDDIDFEEEVIHVQHNKTFPRGKDGPVTTLLKSTAARRDIPMPPDLCVYLKTEKARSRSPFVLSMAGGAALSPNSFYSLWRIVTSRTTDDPEMLGKPVDAKHPHTIKMLDFHCHPHLLRHTYITRLFEAGLDIKEVQYLAGHRTVEMTLKVYTHQCKKTRAAATAQKVKAAFTDTGALPNAGNG